jgi:low temperature requirement protein LtrA
MAPHFWRPPALRTAQADQHRTSTWTELFYDLIFVVCIGELAGLLFRDVSWRGLAEYAGLFAPVWWAWAGGTFYADRFDADDVSHRLVTGLQMLAVAALAVNIHAAYTTTGVGFVLCYVAVRCLIIFNYWRAGAHHPHTRPLTWRYVQGFSLAAALWLGSLLLAPPLRFWLWALAMAVDIATPFTAWEAQLRFPLNRTHLPERIGLFVIIVLGEGVVGIVAGYITAHAGLLAALSGVMGFVVLFCFWWVYFAGLEDGAGLNDNFFHRFIWLNSHVLLLMSLAAIATGVKHAIIAGGGALPDAQRWILCGSVGLSYLMLSTIQLIVLGLDCTKHRKRKMLLRAAHGGAALLVGLLGGSLPALAVGGLLALLGLASILYDLYADPPETQPWAKLAAALAKTGPGIATPA